MPLRGYGTFDCFFGDGSDGTVTQGSTSLTKDKYYKNLIVASNATIDPNGFRIYVNGTLSFTDGNSYIARNGPNGANGASGGAGGTAVGAGPVCLASGGGGAGNDNTVAGSNGTAPSIGLGGRGGAGNDSGGTLGGSSIAITAPADSLGGYRNFPFITSGLIQGPTGNSAIGGGSGGGGGGGGAGAGNRGGGGGAGGGVVYIAARTLDLSVGNIHALGGIGGNGQGTGGGGGGGGGGLIIIVTSQIIGNTNLIAVLGGTKGTGGTNGANGADGQILIFTI